MKIQCPMVASRSEKKSSAAGFASSEIRKSETPPAIKEDVAPLREKWKEALATIADA
jgi:hypothetical protein